MRRALLAALVLALVLVLAGCQAPSFLPGDDGADTPTADMGPTPPEPDGDRLGWENGYWHNETIDVTPGDGLNESEREATVSRAMARVEYVRGLEFEESVSVDVINRSTYRANQSANYSAALERFDNAKFQAMFLIGEDEDSIDVQEETRGASVLGYYSSQREAIVLVADGNSPTLSGEEVLAHELVHALQDQHFRLSNMTAETRDAYQGRNGLVEGDASYVQRLYMDRCGAEWACLDGGDADGATGGDEPGSPADGESDDAPEVHAGVQVLEYFPYSDGPGFVEAMHENGGWGAVDEAYESVPDGATEVTHHDRHYPEWEPASVTVEDRTSADWERIRPPDRPDYGVVGQSAVVAAQAYTITDDYNETAVVLPREVVNVRADNSIDQDDPYRYDTRGAEGWTGGRFHAYERDDGELAYVWRTRWEDRTEADEFAAGWEAIVDHWGGDDVGDGTWVIEEGPFADAYAIRTDGDTVTVVNAPTREGLSAVHGS